MKRKLIAFSLLILFTTLLSSCSSVPPSEQLMPAVTYNGPILSKKSNRDLYLTWQTGKVISAEIPANYEISASPLDTIINGVITSYDHKKNSNAYILKFGKAQQTVFMTSLRDVISNHNLFKTVNLVVNKPSQINNAVLMNVYFNKSQVEKATGDIPIRLDVTLSLQVAGQKTVKTIHVSSDKSIWQNILSSGSFVKSQTNVSEKLMQQIIKAVDNFLETHNV